MTESERVELETAVEAIRSEAHEQQDAAKDYEQTYADGWLDACLAVLDMLWALKAHTTNKPLDV